MSKTTKIPVTFTKEVLLKLLSEDLLEIIKADFQFTTKGIKQIFPDFLSDEEMESLEASNEHLNE